MARSPGRPKSEDCPTVGCTLGKGHGGNCNNFVQCRKTSGCTQKAGHGGPCNAMDLL